MVIHNAILTGSISMQAPPVISGSLTLTGSITSTGPITGSGFFTAGTITAQTLVVQTITSSVSSITGSTKFGSIIGNTHQFTGSMFVTGALYVTTGSVGIGTTTPTQKLHIIGTTGLPAFSGTSQNGTLRLQVTGFTTVLDFGAEGPTTGKQWLQTTDSSNLSIYYPLLLNPRGGSVGIGTTNPTATLHISGSGSGSLMQISSHVSSNIFFVSGSGNIGIGTTSPNGRFEVATGSAGVTVGDFVVDTTNKYVYVGRQSSTSGDNTTFVVRDRTGTARATIPGGGSLDTIFTTNASNFNVTNYGGTSLFFVSGSGNVGIGTSSPNAKLNVVNDDGVGSGLHIIADFNRNTSSAELILGYYADGTNVTTNAVYSANSLPLAFYTGATERMRITSGGVVQIINTGDANLFLSSSAGVSAYVKYANSAGDTWGLGNSFTGANTDFQLYNFTTATYGFKILRAGIYATTATSPRSVFIQSDGTLGGISSIRASKTNIQSFNTNWLYNLNPVQFNYRKKNENGQYTDEFNNELYYGLIAEEAEQINKEICTHNGSELIGIEYSKLIPVLVKAIQELKAEFDEYKTTHP